MKTIKLIACLIALTSFCFSAKAQVTGQNVTFVTAYKNTKAEGIFYQTGPKKWVESKGGSRVHAKFIETGRDAWSVYLKDAARGIRVQLDLYTKKIKVNDEVFYTIGNVKAEKKNFNQNNTSRPTANTQVTGRNATYVRISEKGRVIGAFKQTADKQWTEYKGTRVHAKFTETHRDAWSVYLNDASRGIKAQIDLYRKKVLVNNTPLYTTSNPSARVSYARQAPTRKVSTPTPSISTKNNRRFSNSTSKSTQIGNDKTIVSKEKVKGHNLKTVSFGDDKYFLGSFIQMNKSKNWFYRTRAGHTEDYLTETDRDEWSVYLKSTKSAKVVQIDLYQKKITVKSNGKTTKYNVRNSIGH